MRDIQKFLKALSLRDIIFIIVLGIVGILGWVWLWNFISDWHTNQTKKKNKVNLPIYELVSGETKFISHPNTFWSNTEFQAVLQGNSSKIKLPKNDVVIKFTGEIGIPKVSSSQVYLLSGKASFRVASQPANTPFQVVSRVGNIIVLGTDFDAEVQQPLPKPNQKLEDTQAELKVEVHAGKVAVLAQGQKRPQPIPAGQNQTFLLEEMRLNNKISAIGIGELPTIKNPAQAKMVQKRSAEVDLARSFQEFTTGMEFTATFKNNSVLFEKAEFRVEGGIQQLPNISKREEILSPQVLILHGEVEVERKDAKNRRNGKTYQGQGAVYPEKAKNYGMAVQTARLNAILSAIQTAAFEYYGDELPEQLQGKFYPQSFSLKMKDNIWIGEVLGEVVFQ